MRGWENDRRLALADGRGPLAGDPSVAGPSTSPVLFELAGVSCAVLMSQIFGRLRISSGEVAFLPEGWGNSLNLESAIPVVHRDRELTVVFGRFWLPWMNSGLVLVDDAGSPGTVGLVNLPGWQRQPVVLAAERAGFDVTVYRTRFSSGASIGTVSELERFRREHN